MIVYLSLYHMLIIEDCLLAADLFFPSLSSDHVLNLLREKNKRYKETES